LRDDSFHREAGGRSQLAGFDVGEFFCAVGHFDLSDAAGAAEGYEAEDRHHQSVHDCETDQPENGARLPLTPGYEDAISCENDEHCAGEFVEDLAGDTPEGAECYGGGAPEGGEHVRRHGEIVEEKSDFKFKISNFK
jgi:hypothetical protein